MKHIWALTHKTTLENEYTYQLYLKAKALPLRKIWNCLCFFEKHNTYHKISLGIFIQTIHLNNLS